MKKYPKMKDSGIEWIGDIPEDWEIDKIKYHFNIITGKVLQSEQKTTNDLLVDYITAGDVQWGKVNYDKLSQMWATEDQIKKIEVKNNDLLICEGGEAGRSGIMSNLKNKCIIQNHIHRVRPKNDSSCKFLLYLMEYFNSSGILKSFVGRVTISSLPRLTLENFPMITPLNEQKDIGEFLDKHAPKINSEILKNEKLIGLLEEKKQTIINQTITKGLDLSLPMKDSGIEWIGDIPEDWNKSSVRQVTKFIKSGLSRLLTREDIGYPVVRSGNIEQGKLLLDDVKYWYKEDTKGVNLLNFILENEDILLNFINSMAQIGKSCLFVKQDRDWIYTTNVFRIKIDDKKIIPKYFVYFLNSKYMQDLMTSISQPAVNQASFTKDDFKQLSIVYPDLNTQNKIILFLDNITAKIEDTILKLEMQISKLKEARQALIFSTITGKIDVREVVA